MFKKWYDWFVIIPFWLAMFTLGISIGKDTLFGINIYWIIAVEIGLYFLLSIIIFIYEVAPLRRLATEYEDDKDKEPKI